MAISRRTACISRYNLNARPSPDDAKAQARIAAEPGVIRAHELFACDMADEANAEWSAALGDAEPAVKVQAAHLAARWGWYARVHRHSRAGGRMG